MGVDFIGRGGLSLTWQQWRYCFQLACAFGWRPSGTVVPDGYPEPDRWTGDYFTNDLRWSATRTPRHWLRPCAERSLR